MSGASCRGLYRKLEILLVPCQYTLSVMLFISVNPNNFQKGCMTEFVDLQNDMYVCMYVNVDGRSCMKKHCIE